MAVAVALAGVVARADIPVPARLTQPANAAEAWNVIRLATENTRILFEENRVEETKEQIVLMGPSLRVLAREGALPDRQLEAESLSTAAFERINLLVRESMAGNLEGARSVFSILRQDLGKLESLFPPGMPSAEIYSCVDHPEIAEVDPGLRCSECGNMLRPRRFPYSVIFTRTVAPQLRLDLKAGEGLVAGERNPLMLRLTTEDEKPVSAEDLVISHSRRLHLILVDEEGTDFQHLAPEPGNEPGVFQTSFVPVSAGGYRAWVVAVPAATRLTETLPSTLPGATATKATPPPSDRGGESFVAESEGVVVRLLGTGSGPLRIRGGMTNLLQVHVSRSDGTPLRELEPLWNAFVHLTLISWDFSSAHQVHAVGGEILSPALRGGPEFAFKLHPPASGWWRLYLQLRLEGRTLTFPLKIEALE